MGRGINPPVVNQSTNVEHRSTFIKRAVNFYNPFHLRPSRNILKTNQTLYCHIAMSDRVTFQYALVCHITPILVWHESTKLVNIEMKKNTLHRWKRKLTKVSSLSVPKRRKSVPFLRLSGTIWWSMDNTITRISVSAISTVNSHLLSKSLFTILPPHHENQSLSLPSSYLVVYYACCRLSLSNGNETLHWS